MIWKKIGKIFCADKNTDLMVVGARAPVALHLRDDLFRIYFGAYDSQMRGKIYSLEIDLNDPQNIKNLKTDPVIDKGDIGFYDDNGIITSSILNHLNKIYLYTIGFSVKNKILFDAASGLAISKDKGKSFKKFPGPVIDRTIYDPCFAASPCVLFDENKFKMWYVSGEKWERKKNLHLKHYYKIKYKESNDGIHWDNMASVAIDYENEYEYAIARPSIIKDGEKDYKMWYCYRGQKNINTYRIGYAESENGLRWVRKDRLMQQFDVSKNGWDSEMICYPFVFDHKGKRYMLYNGNGYGKTGFGLAVTEV